jgi:hypothetical protein
MIAVDEAFPLAKFGMHDVVVALQTNETSYVVQMLCVADVLHVVHCAFDVQPLSKHVAQADARNASKISMCAELFLFDRAEKCMFRDNNL